MVGEPCVESLVKKSRDNIAATDQDAGHVSGIKRFLAGCREQCTPSVAQGPTVEVRFTLEGIVRFQRVQGSISTSETSRPAPKRKRPNYNNAKRRFLAKRLDRVKWLVFDSDIQ